LLLEAKIVIAGDHQLVAVRQTAQPLRRGQHFLGQTPPTQITAMQENVSVGHGQSPKSVVSIG
jgi:hypothetical protein